MQNHNEIPLSAESIPVNGNSYVNNVRFFLDIGQKSFFDAQEPVGFTHNLMELDIFDIGYLADLSDLYHPNDYFVTSGAAAPGVPFYSTGRLTDRPRDAMSKLSEEPTRVLLKRPEKYDPNFRALLCKIHSYLAGIEKGPPINDLVRLEGAVLISSAATITPFHFDPEFGFFCQIEGDKIYHVYSPVAVREQDLERFFVRGVVDIGGLDLENCDSRHEHVFALRPGDGFYQPHNAPHWVETSNSRSISYTCVFQTRDAAALGRVRAFNHYARKLGWTPGTPGLNPGRDAAKASLMQAVTPVRRALSHAASALGR